MSDTEVMNVAQSLEKLEEHRLCSCLVPLRFYDGEKSSRDESRPFNACREAWVVQEVANREVISGHVKFIGLHARIVEGSEQLCNLKGQLNTMIYIIVKERSVHLCDGVYASRLPPSPDCVVAEPLHSLER